MQTPNQMNIPAIITIKDFPAATNAQLGLLKVIGCGGDRWEWPKVKFTPKEWEIIAHRLEVGDAIADAMTDHAEGETPETTNTHEEVEDRANEILKGGQGSIDWGNPLDLAILKDCCEGSTFLCELDDAVATGEITKGEAMATQRAADSLGRKLNVEVTQ